MSENPSQFEIRKKDHIRLAMDEKVQATELYELDKVKLIHEALPDLNFEEVSTETSFLFHKLNSPIFISSMTAGHLEGVRINEMLAGLSQEKQILMGVGSQRRELHDSAASAEWKQIKKLCPKSLLIANIGISQLIQEPISKIQKLVDNLEAVGLFIHLNSLQECLQPEGTTNFKGGLKAIEQATKVLSVPVIIKEVGCGFSKPTLKRLNETGVYAVDLSGAGGTHWGRIEGYRNTQESIKYLAAKNFANWGISTVQSMVNAISINPKYKVWASGGVRNGLDCAKLLAMGANMVGIGQPFLKAIIENKTLVENKSSNELEKVYEQLHFELKLALFCTGSKNLEELKTSKVIVSEKYD